MTGYHIRLGYNPNPPADDDAMWEALKRTARRVADDPAAIVREARRLDAPETCDEGCCTLESYAEPYAMPFGELGHPVKIHQVGDYPDASNQIMQLASTDDDIKYHVRRAYVRLLVEAMHRQGIEVSLTVA